MLRRSSLHLLSLRMSNLMILWWASKPSSYWSLKPKTDFFFSYSGNCLDPFCPSFQSITLMRPSNSSMPSMLQIVISLFYNWFVFLSDHPLALYVFSSSAAFKNKSKLTKLSFFLTFTHGIDSPYQSLIILKVVPALQTSALSIPAQMAYLSEAPVRVDVSINNYTTDILLNPTIVSWVSHREVLFRHVHSFESVTGFPELVSGSSQHSIISLDLLT